MISQNIFLLSSLLLLLLLNLGYANNGPIPGSTKAQKQENMSSHAIVPGFSVWNQSKLIIFKKPLIIYRCFYGCLPPPKKHHHHHRHHRSPPPPSPSPSPSPFPFPPPFNQHHHHRPPHPRHRHHQPKPNTIMDQPKPMQKGKQDGH